MKVHLQYPWRFSDSPYYKYLITDPPQGIEYLNAHQGKGWEQFTDKIISVINDQERSVVFVLWGAYAQKKGNLIDEQKHLVIRSPHPSPLSAYRGFYGSKPFTKINNYLQEQEQTEIDWET